MREFPVSISQAFISVQRLYLRACPASIGPVRTTHTTNNEQPTTAPHRLHWTDKPWRIGVLDGGVTADGPNGDGELAPAINRSRHLFQGHGEVVKREQGWYESRHPHKRTLGSCVRCTVQELLSGLAPEWQSIVLLFDGPGIALSGEGKIY